MGCHLYTQEEKQFFAEYAPGHSYKEIQEEFNKRFDWSITVSQVKGSLARYGLTTGRTGRFQKGHPSPNKGKKGICFPGSEKGHFKKGQMPKNYRPVGSERVNVDGYLEIKVADPKTWKAKHRVIWEEANGPIPKGSCLIFLDGNKKNIALDNLMLITRNTQVRMTQKSLFFSDPELTRTGVHFAELMNMTGEAERRRKKRDSKDVSPK